MADSSNPPPPSDPNSPQSPVGSGGTILPSTLQERKAMPGRYRNVIKWSVGLGLLGVVIVGGAFVSKPVYKRWEDREATKLAAQAAEQMKTEKWDDASRILGEAYRKSPTNESVMRGILELITKSSPSAERQLYFYRQISAVGHLSMEDKVRMAECHLALRQGAEAHQILDGFTPAEREGRYGLELQALMLRSEGRMEEATKLYRESLLLATDDPQARLKLAGMDLRSAFTEVQTQATEMLWQLARGRDAIALSAMDVLASDVRLTPAQSEELLKLINEHPFASARRRFGVLTAYLRVNPSRKDVIVGAESSKVEGKPVEERMDFLRWLSSTGDQERFLKLVPMEKALLMRELFPPYVEALATAQRWEELKEVMKKATVVPLTEAEKALLEARLARGLNEPSRIVRGYFQEACRHAAAMKDYRGLLRSAGFAEEAGYTDLALEAYMNAAKASKDPALMERILAMQQRRQDPEAILTVLDEILAVQPLGREHWSSALYLKLLIGREIETSAALVPALLGDGRLASNSARFLEALVAYRAMDLDRVKAELAVVDPGSLPAGQRAVLARLLSDCGETARAFAIA
ncbi:MAG: hypothetical protein ACAI34_06080, partial [Verrucomicrobium sp.]